MATALTGLGLVGQSHALPFSTDASVDYDVQKIEGWNVLVNKRFLAEHPDLAAQMLALVQHQLYQVVRSVPPGPLKKLQTIRIWVEEKALPTPCSAYHPNVDWLREHHVNPEKAHCVELANARNFLKWSDEQPWMLLHELAHAYHHQYLKGGFENPEVQDAFRRATAARRYESVLRINGRNDRAYAAMNPMEYFAESSEAYFGTNDFYPFVRAELLRHDPEMYALLRKLWEMP